MTFDHTLFHIINQGLVNPVFDFLCPVIRNKYTWFPVYIGGSAYVIYKYRLQGVWIVAFAGLAILLGDQSSNLIKHFVHRLRPCHTEPGVRLLIDTCSDTFSFTSNHATNHFALSVFVACMFRESRVLIALMLLWAVSVAFSQVYIGIHFPVDVTAGAILGSLIGAGTFMLFKKVWISYLK